MNERSHSIALAEQQVAEARTAALAEYEAVRAKLRHRIGSPVFIGGALLGATVLGYLAFGRGRPRRLADTGMPGAWSRAGKTVQVLLPLLIALNSVSKAARGPRGNIDGTAR